MKKITLLTFLLTAFFGFSQNTVTVPVTTTNSGDYLSFMNVFDNPADPTPNCPGPDAPFCFGIFGWDIVNLAAVIGANDVTLSPNVNTYSDALGGNNGDRDYWTNSPDGGVTAGPDGNKWMEAILFVEPSGFNGQDLTFTGQVTSNTLDPRYTASYFIKALDPNNGFADTFNGSKTIELPASGTFSISATGAELASGLIVQYGLVVEGLNANPADDWGNVVVAPVALSTTELESTEFRTFPNPTTSEWNINSNTEMSKVALFDLLGKQVLTVTPNSNEVSIDATSFKTGVYFARIEGVNGTKTVKLVRQ